MATVTIVTPSAQQALDNTIAPLGQYLLSASQDQVESLINNSLSPYTVRDFYDNYLANFETSNTSLSTNRLNAAVPAVTPLKEAFLSYFVDQIWLYADYLAHNPFNLIDQTLEYTLDQNSDMSESQQNTAVLPQPVIDDYIIYRSFNPYPYLLQNNLLAPQPGFHYNTRLGDRRYATMATITNQATATRNAKAALLQYLFANYKPLMERTWQALTNLAASVGLVVPEEYQLVPPVVADATGEAAFNTPQHNLVLAILEALLQRLFVAVDQFETEADRRITFMELRALIKRVIAPSQGQ